jgi:hypothetical protein
MSGLRPTPSTYTTPASSPGRSRSARAPPPNDHVKMHNTVSGYRIISQRVGSLARARVVDALSRSSDASAFGPMSQVRIRRSDVFVAHVERSVLRSTNHGYGCRNDSGAIVVEVDVVSNPDRLAYPSMRLDAFFRHALRESGIRRAERDGNRDRAEQSSLKRHCAVIEPAGRNGSRMHRRLIERSLGADRVRRQVSGNHNARASPGSRTIKTPLLLSRSYFRGILTGDGRRIVLATICPSGVEVISPCAMS